MNETEVKQDSIGLKDVHRSILILCWEYPPNVVGGLSRHVSGISSYLAGLGLNVHVLTAGNGNLPPYDYFNNVHVHRVKPLNYHDKHFFTWIGGLNLAMIYKACELAEEIKFDLIHAHDWLVGVAGIVLKETFDLPLLTTIHGTEYGRNNGIYNEMQRFIHEKEQLLMDQSNLIIVCSHYMKQELVSVFHIHKNKIVVIPNGIEITKGIINQKDFFQNRDDKKIIFSIGRMVEEKGFKTIIKAASIVKDKNLKLIFIIAGKGPMLERYRQEVMKRGLEEFVSFIGYVSDEEKNAYILHSNIVVFPSLYEPFGIVALESMFLGKPTIVSDTGGLKGMVEHMKTGLLMVPGNAESLLQQISFLLQNPKKAAEIGLRGKKLVKGLYGWKRIAAETKRVMDDLIIHDRIDGKQNSLINDMVRIQEKGGVF
jgi:glycogen synthase